MASDTDRPTVDASTPTSRPKLVSSHIDKRIWGIYSAIIFFSILELYSASSREVTAGHIMAPLFRHIGLLGVGCVIMLALQKVHYRVFYKLTWLIVGASVLMAIITNFFGSNLNGAQRSVTFIFFSIQPSELLKFSSALVIARVLGDGQIKVDGRPTVRTSSVVWVCVIVVVFSALLIKQGLTNAVLLVAISYSMMVVCGVSWKHLLIIFAVCLVGAAGYWGYTKYKADHREKDSTEQVERSGVRVSRIDYYLAPNKYDHDITPENQQAQYSFIAQANGGLFGAGIGNSRETARLPLAFSDYIFAIIIEEGGLFLGFVIIVLFLLLLARAGRVGLQLKQAFPALLIIGMAVFIVYQALFHMAIVTGLFPVSGQTLPFFSKGGSSVIMSSVALGVMLSVSRYAARKNENDDRESPTTSLTENN